MNRFLALLLASLLLCPAALAEVFIVTYDGSGEASDYSLLLTDDGTALTPPDTYGRIFRLIPDDAPEEQRRFKAEPAHVSLDLNGADVDELPWYDYHRVALLAADGRQLTGFDYYGLLMMTDGTIAYSVPGSEALLYGAMDRDGNILLEARYADLQGMGDGRYLAMLPEGENAYAVVLADVDGTEKALGLTTDSPILPEPSQGLCVVNDVLEYGGGSVYIDRDGAVRISGTFDRAEPFFGRFARVEVGDHMGLIDTEGRFAVPPEYDWIFDDSGDIFVAKNGTTLTLLDANTGEVLMSRDFGPCEYVDGMVNVPGFLWVCTDQTEYCCRTDGTLLATFEGEDSWTLVNCTPDAPRLIVFSGEWPEYDARLTDLEGNALSKSYQNLYEDLWRDGEGRYVTTIMPIITTADGEPTGDWWHSRSGVIDQDGREILPPVYDEDVVVLAPDRYWVSTGDKTGMIDGAGHWYYTISNYDALMD